MSRRIAIVALAVPIVVLALSEAIVPGYVAGRVEQRLTAEGGTATVHLSGQPALRLLDFHGRRISVTGRGMAVDLVKPKDRVFDKLDGFDQVDVHIQDLQAGPVDTQRLDLTRDRPGAPYRLHMTATTTPNALADFAAAYFGGLVGAAARLFAPDSSAPLPVDMDLSLVSRKGRAEVQGGDATVAGIPTGPFGAAIAAAVLARF